VIININLTNENLQVGDEVFPVGYGTIRGNDFDLEYFDFRPYMSGYPDDPHTILDLHYSDDKGYEVRTDKGYGPKKIYFKSIIPKKEGD